MPAGFYNGSIMFADNVRFDGQEQPGQVTSDGQLLIGSTSAPNIRVGTLASGDSTIAITNGAGTIDLKSGNTVATTYTGDTGSAVPAAKALTIYSNIAANNSGASISFTNSGATSTFNTTDSLNNVMIGKSSGNTTITGNGNTFVGFESGLNTSSGSGDVCIGYRAGKTNTTGSDVVAIGSQALTTYNASFSVGVGSAALQLSTNGTNVAVGYGAGSNITTGTRNTCVGTTASGSALQTGSNNCTFGHEAGKNMTGTDNTFIGYQTGIGWTGNTNTVVGSSAGTGTGTANQNALVGYQTGNAITNGIGNTGCGYASLNKLTTGNYNTCIGWQTGFNLETGGYNTHIGYNAGSNNTLANSSNIYIGNAGSAGESNRMRLGTQGTGNGQVSQTYLAGVLNHLSGTVQKVTTPGAYPYTLATTDYMIKVDTSVARTITPLANPIQGTVFVIKDDTGSAAANNITITPSGKNIDGAASYVINTNYGRATIIYNGTQWNVI